MTNTEAAVALEPCPVADIAGAKKAASAVYLATEASVARDLESILRGLISEVEWHRAAMAAMPVNEPLVDVASDIDKARREGWAQGMKDTLASIQSAGKMSAAMPSRAEVLETAAKVVVSKAAVWRIEASRADNEIERKHYESMVRAAEWCEAAIRALTQATPAVPAVPGEDGGTFRCPICGLTEPHHHDVESPDGLIIQLGAALAKSRRVARLWSGTQAAMDHLEWGARQEDMSAVDVALGAYFGWRKRKGLLLDAEWLSGNVDPDHTKEKGNG